MNNVSLIALIFSQEVYFIKHSMYSDSVFVTLLETGTHMLMRAKR